MSAVARAFPAGPTLAAWWQQLSPLQPRELWVARLAVQRVEALVRVEHPCPLDRLSLRILDILAHAETIEALEQQTGLHRQFLHRALTSLRAEGLADANSPGKWHLSTAGRQALGAGSYARLVPERRTFHFRAGVAGASSFLPLLRLEAWQPGAEQHFDSAALDDCLQRPRDWKEQHGFPLDVRARATPDVPAQADWRQVTVVTPMQLTLALAVTDEVRGFVCEGDGWELDTAEPVCTLGSASQDVLPELATSPSADVCAAAWREWCEAQGHPKAAAARLELKGHQLLVTLAAGIDERLRSQARESWLLIGAGDIRRAARIEIQET
jgi:hypothetical protein